MINLTRIFFISLQLVSIMIGYQIRNNILSKTVLNDVHFQSIFSIIIKTFPISIILLSGTTFKCIDKCSSYISIRY